MDIADEPPGTRFLLFPQAPFLDNFPEPELVEVSALTIYHWEHGHSKPRAAQLARWLNVKTFGKPEAWTKLGYE